MPNRRMFSLKIVDTDAFLEMPQTSQLLYFHLCMRADDDGFVSNPKKISKMISSGDDDTKVLMIKRFIIPFENGVIVIKHWRMHNLIRSDRYTETNYLKEKSKLTIKENGSYTEINKTKQNVIPNGNQMAPQVRLGKDRLGKVNTIVSKADDKVFSLKEKIESPLSPLLPKVISIWNSYSTPSIGNWRNKTLSKKGLPLCRGETKDIKTVFNKMTKGKRTLSEMETAIKNYMTEIANRDISNSYALHRFSFYEFFKQANGFTKFSNK